MTEAHDDASRRARLARDRLEHALRDVDDVTMVDIGLADDGRATAPDAPPARAVVLRVHVRGTPTVGLPRHWDGFAVVVVRGDYRPERTARRCNDEEEDRW